MNYQFRKNTNIFGKIMKKLLPYRQICLIFLLFPFLTSASGYKTPQIDDYLDILAVPANQNDKKETQTPLTLQACIRIATSESPTIQAALENTKSAEASTTIMKAAYFPELGVSSSFNRWKTHSFIPSGLSSNLSTSTTGPTDDWSFRAEASYLLYDSGARSSKYRRATAQREVAKEEMNRIGQTIILQVNYNFYSVLTAQEAHKVWVKNLERAEESLRVAKLRESNGVSTIADVIKAQLEVANAKLELVRAEKATAVAKGNLNTIMGLPAEKNLILATPIPEKNTEMEIPDINMALDEAIHNRPEIKMALNRIGAAKESVKLAKSAFGPKLKLQSKYGYRDSEFFPEDRDWSVSVALALPLFNGFSRSGSLRQSKAYLSKEEREIEKLMLQIVSEVWTAYYRLKETKEAVIAAEIIKKEGAENLNISRQQYKAGILTISDLLSAQTALARAELTALEYYWQYYTALASFNYAKGM